MIIYVVPDGTLVWSLMVLARMLKEIIPSCSIGWCFRSYDNLCPIRDKDKKGLAKENEVNPVRD